MAMVTFVAIDDFSHWNPNYFGLLKFLSLLCVVFPGAIYSDQSSILAHSSRCNSSC